MSVKRITTVRQDIPVRPKWHAGMLGVATVVDSLSWVRRDHGNAREVDLSDRTQHWSPTLTMGGYGGDFIPWAKRDHGGAGEIDPTDRKQKWSPANASGGYGGDFVAWVRRDHGTAGEVDPSSKVSHWGPQNTTGGYGGDFLAWNRPRPFYPAVDDILQVFTHLPITDVEQLAFLHRTSRTDALADLPVLRAFVPITVVTPPPTPAEQLAFLRRPQVSDYAPLDIQPPHIAWAAIFVRPPAPPVFSLVWTDVTNISLSWTDITVLGAGWSDITNTEIVWEGGIEP